MRYGLKLPQTGPNLTGADILRFARTAERLGFHFLSVGDHVVFPEHIASAYPYDSSGRHPSESTLNYVEPLTLLTFVAGATTSIRLATGVLILPYRHPVLAAKVLASLDFLTQGRLIVGVGVGWMKEEFDVLGFPYEHRGALTDEILDVFKVLWTQEHPRYRGRFFSFDELRFSPRPVQKPHPPIWVGGHTRPAMRRAVRAGQGWFTTQLRPQELRPLVQEFHSLAAAAGRSPADFDVCVGLGLEFAGSAPPPELRRNIIGNGDRQQIIEELQALAGMGVTVVQFDFRTRDVGARLETIQRFAEEVRPFAP